jgi:predicted site-specific integrase-resolvase
MWYSSGKLAKRLHVSPQTIRRWVKEGKYDKTRKTNGGHFRIWVAPERRLVFYCRVSSKKQISSLYKQEELLKEAHGECPVYKDVASGFNFQRRGFKALLELVLSGTPVEIVATTSDRITRTGFKFIKWIVELHGGCITLLEEDVEAEGFDINILIGFITSFIASTHGKRSHRRKKNQSVPRE